MSEQRALRLYDGILAAVAERADAIEGRPLASHWPHVGSRYRTGGLLVAGQALQGWDERVDGARWGAAEAGTPEGRAAILAQTRAWAATQPEPVGVIAELGSRARSPFWRLTHDLVGALAPGDGVWYSRFAWTNVYPVAFDYGPPNHRGDSPWGALKEAQDPLAGRLFAALVEMLDPGVVVVIAGPNFWWHTARAAGFGEALEPRKLPLMAAGVIAGRRWVVGYHPTYARRKRFGAAAYAEQIVAAVRELAGP
jgi:hypothetical protein